MGLVELRKFHTQDDFLDFAAATIERSITGSTTGAGSPIGAGDGTAMLEELALADDADGVEFEKFNIFSIILAKSFRKVSMSR